MYLGHKGTIKKAICTGIGSITCHQFFDYVICCLYNAHTFTIHYVSAISIALGIPSLEMHFSLQKRNLLISDTNSVRSNSSIKLTDIIQTNIPIIYQRIMIQQSTMNKEKHSELHHLYIITPTEP